MKKSGAVFFLAAMLLSGQVLSQFTATGVVKDNNGDPLIGVIVEVENTNIGSATDVEGKFSLNVPGESGILIFSYTGFKTEKKEVSKSNPDVNLVMTFRAEELDEVVVSGLATSVKRSNLANSVASISAGEIAGVTPQQTLDGALYGKFKGANIVANSGAPGGGISIKMRGITSIGGNTQPLYIIDGIYIDNSSISPGLNFVSKAGSGGNTSSQDNPSNRIADIDPDDIEKIEILKGASAAAIYGSRAAGGVVIITTKRGKRGINQEGFSVNFTQSIGQTSIINKLGMRDWTVEKVRSAFGTDSTGKGLEEDNFLAGKNSGNLIDYEDKLYGNKGLLSNSRLNISGGNSKTAYFAGVTLKNEEGIVENTGYKKNSFRLNVDHKATNWLDINLSNNYIVSSTDRGFFNNDNSSTTMGMSLVSTPPWAKLLPDENSNYPDNPYAGSNFLQTSALITNNEKVNRIISGAIVTAKLISSKNHNLKFITRGGVDNYALQTTAIFPRDLQFQKNGNGTNGASIQGATVNTNTNIASFLVHTFYPNSQKFSLRTQAGITREDFRQNLMLVTATQLIGSQTNLDQAGSKDVVQQRLEQHDRGFFVQEELNVSDKVIASIGLRADKSSNNGDVNKLYYYPKASVAVNIHEFTSIGEQNELKIRTAYGQSGNFAVFGDKYTSLVPTTIEGTPGSLINTTRGNERIGPERQKELEGGFDLSVLNGKAMLDVTLYKKQVTDLILNAAVPTSSGYSSMVSNPADLQNSGVEIGLGLQVLDKKGLKWFSRTSFWKNKSKITRLNIPAFNTGAFGATLATFRIEEGKSATQIVGIGPPEKDEDGDGLVVWGDAAPDFQTSFYNTLKYKNFDFSFLVHWKQGGQNINLTTLLTDIYQTSPDFDDKTLDPEGKMINGEYRLNALGSSAEPWVQDASYVKVREIGLYYNVPVKSLDKLFNKTVQSVKIGLSGYNLFNFFKYGGYDPEVSNFGSNGISTGVEVVPFPSAKRYYFHLSVGF